MYPHNAHATEGTVVWVYMSGHTVNVKRKGGGANERGKKKQLVINCGKRKGV